MRINLQMFGGRGANSQGKRAKASKGKFVIPDNITKRQKDKLEYIKNMTLDAEYGSTKDKYEIKKFDVSVDDLGNASVIVEAGLKNDEGTMASVLTRNTAIIFIGKNGGMKHMTKDSYNLKPTKYLSQAFYDYTYGKGKR